MIRQVYPDNVLNSGLSQVQCDGSEMSLLECNISYLSPAVPSLKDAAVVCQAQSTPISNCSNGDIRLVNGTTVLEGRLEICINNAWGTVCSQGFTADDAEVVCQQLKLPFNSVFNSGSSCCLIIIIIMSMFGLHIRFNCVS